MKIKFLIIALIFINFYQKTIAEKRKMLMIGNSYIYTNDLPTMLTGLALSMGDTLEISSVAPGGYSFFQHSTNATTLSTIAQGVWDYVVLQAQSQEPSFSPTQVASNTYPYAKKLDSLIHVSNPCAETIFYMTWGKKYGDTVNCASYPVICTYSGVYGRLRESYLQMTQDNSATFAPVGVSWDRIINNNPTIELFNADGSHPNPNGTYLTACTFYATIYHKSCAGAQYAPGTVTNGDAFLFQTVASQTVLDSLENWQQFGNLPFAKFSNNVNANAIDFTNLSLRSSQYLWNFGDGSVINTQLNPSYTYTTNGNYTVKLISKNACNKYDIFIKQIQINNAPNNVDEININDKESIFYFNNQIIVSSKNARNIIIFNHLGQQILNQDIDELNNKILFNNYAVGIYYFQMQNKNGSFIKGKFIVD